VITALTMSVTEVISFGVTFVAGLWLGFWLKGKLTQAKAAINNLSEYRPFK
jgi:hypothetical protein